MLEQQLVNGLMVGSVYALIAVAFTLAIGVLNFLNFSLPGLFMVAGMLLVLAWRKRYSSQEAKKNVLFLPL